MGTLIPAVAGSGNLALGSSSSMMEQEEAGEDGGHEACKIQAPASAGLGRQIWVWLHRPAISSRQINMDWLRAEGMFALEFISEFLNAS
ncbi:unnamed protein product [Miscanthus lutarioriparius]|uniref:Uncharacterized protein n=1 Tax=Miscanthus lutarioriparius TaxID=422564 RepID=A0A811N9U6_9POAL|nr:unnamed protein product [Miscanthus lutarioriparius]